MDSPDAVGPVYDVLAGMGLVPYNCMEEMDKKANAAMHEGDAVTGDMAPLEDVDALEGQELMVWAGDMLDRLTLGHQKLVEKVLNTGLGKCAKCSYGAGCHLCDWMKATRYYRRIETLDLHGGVQG